MSSNNKNSVKKISFHEVDIKPKNKELTNVKILYESPLYEKSMNAKTKQLTIKD